MKPQQSTRAARQGGFSLAEVLVATALAGVVLAAAAYMFGQSVDVSTIASLRGEMQQNARVAINLIYRDISVAGTGIPSGGIQLPYSTSGGINLPRIGCDTSATCWVLNPSGSAALNYYQTLNGGANYANGSSSYNSWMYAINPQDGQGASISTPNSSGTVDGDPWASTTTTVPTDVITVVFKDNNYPTTWTYPGGGACASGSVTNSQPTTAPPTTGCSSAGPLDQWTVSSIDISNTSSPTVTFQSSNPQVWDTVYGLNQGDVLLFNNSNGAAVGVVTNVTANSNVVSLSTNDSLYINQITIPIGGSSGGSKYGGLSSIQNFSAGVALGTFPATTVYRIVVVTYYIYYDSVSGNPRLMRQVNSSIPSPVAENIENLQFSYDVFDTTSNTVCPNIANPYNPSTACTPGVYYSPNQIGKVNIFVQARSNGQRLVGRGYSRLSMISAVTPRNLDFIDRYP
jgi:prepilin-type N-terminal cleavage/methylation domain-containing protein